MLCEVVPNGEEREDPAPVRTVGWVADEKGKGDNCCDASKRCKGKSCCKECDRDERKDKDVCNMCDDRGRDCMKLEGGGLDGGPYGTSKIYIGGLYLAVLVYMFL